ncbi:glyoxalase/bleomycin resistance/extradiol dioxygenase family protein [Pararhizobium antarcticum]|uniref:Bleomycin resistance protein n=1 Tax=Pararhizobium antarcticum TaxID=1798805 RepID=A0A657LST8_9HYPH|nr:glyoxalase/bleomycin resistance/extradiol dioxygenase family protein [Pararhizobium antarcticum]OJF96111.1 bleomycin resistance protein [Pararhizobium antarcticum]OJG01258.1 bleomycin resistance protein [Rhizobium sp. 58]
MRIAHVALWTDDLDRLCAFWETTFDAIAGDRYESRNRPGFSSRFLTLKDGPSLEIMQGPWIAAPETMPERAGYAHIALSLGSRQAVDALADAAASKGILSSPARMTGDGFYEAVLRDPDGNLIEITV